MPSNTTSRSPATGRYRDHTADFSGSQAVGSRGPTNDVTWMYRSELPLVAAGLYATSVLANTAGVLDHRAALGTWLPIHDAARRLGILELLAYRFVSEGKLRSRRRDDGTVEAWVADTDATSQRPTQSSDPGHDGRYLVLAERLADAGRRTDAEPDGIIRYTLMAEWEESPVTIEMRFDAIQWSRLSASSTGSSSPPMVHRLARVRQLESDDPRQLPCAPFGPKCAAD